MFSQDFKKCQILKFKTLLKQSHVLCCNNELTKFNQINVWIGWPNQWDRPFFCELGTTPDMVVDRKHWGLIQQQPLPQLQVKKGSLNYLIVIKRRRIAITWSTTIHMVSTIFILYPILLCCYQTCAARDTISVEFWLSIC